MSQSTNTSSKYIPYILMVVGIVLQVIFFTGKENQSFYSYFIPATLGLILLIVGITKLNAQTKLEAEAGFAYKDVDDEGSWKRVADDDVQRMLNLSRECTQYNKSAQKGCLFRIVVFAIVGVLLAFPSFISPESPTSKILMWLYLIIDGILLANISNVSGVTKISVPNEFHKKDETITTVLNWKEQNRSRLAENDIDLVPQVLFKTTTESKLVPNDIRFMMQSNNASSDFVCSQMSIRLNTVQSKDYPYFISVFVVKKGSILEAKLAHAANNHHIPAALSWEQDHNNAEMGVFVMKIDSGFVTFPEDIKSMLDLTLKIFESEVV